MKTDDLDYEADILAYIAIWSILASERDSPFLEIVLLSQEHTAHLDHWTLRD